MKLTIETIDGMIEKHEESIILLRRLRRIEQKKLPKRKTHLVENAWGNLVEVEKK